MSSPQRIKQLGQVVDLRERDVERLSVEMASKRLVRQRYVDNLTRLEALCVSSGASGTHKHLGEARQTLSPALSLNVGGYKQSVMRMAAAHRVDLALHESEMQLTQRQMTSAVRRHEALDQVLVREREGLQRHSKVREQKRQDDLATQLWLRGRK